jgi:cell division protein FtsB
MAFEKRPIAPAVYLIIIGILVLVSGTLWFGYNNGNQTIETQKITIKNLQTEYNSSILINAGLKTQIANLTRDKESLQTDILTLTHLSNTLQAQITKLDDNVTTLKGQVNQLNTEITKNHAEISNLTTANTAIRNQVNTLNGEITTLQRQISNQTAIINLGKTLTLANDDNVTVLANHESYLNFKTNYAGYLSITFTSSTGVSLQIGSSEATETWYGVYPNSGTTMVGSFKIPVMPGTTYIKIKNPSLTNEATLFYYITYYY